MILSANPLTADVFYKTLFEMATLESITKWLLIAIIGLFWCMTVVAAGNAEHGTGLNNEQAITWFNTTTHRLDDSNVRLFTKPQWSHPNDSFNFISQIKANAHWLKSSEDSKQTDPIRQIVIKIWRFISIIPLSTVAWLFLGGLVGYLKCQRKKLSTKT